LEQINNDDDDDDEVITIIISLFCPKIVINIEYLQINDNLRMDC